MAPILFLQQAETRSKCCTYTAGIDASNIVAAGRRSRTDAEKLQSRLHPSKGGDSSSSDVVWAAPVVSQPTAPSSQCDGCGVDLYHCLSVQDDGNTGNENARPSNVCNKGVLP